MPYTRQDVIKTYREHFPELAPLNDNDVWRVAAVNDPELAKGISELQDTGFRSPRYGPTGATATQVMSDQAANVLTGAGSVVGLKGTGTGVSLGIPDWLKRLGQGAGDVANAPVPGYEAGMRLLRAARGGMEGSARLENLIGGGVKELLMPGSTQTPPPESPEWTQAAQASGAMLTAAELPNVASGAALLTKAGMKPLAAGARKIVASISPEKVNGWLEVKPTALEHGANPGQRIVDEGLLAPTKSKTAANLKTALDGSSAKIEQTLKQADATGLTLDNSNAILDTLQQATATIGKSEPAFQARLEGILNQILGKFPNIDKMSPSQTQALIRELGDGVKWTGAAYEGDVNQVLVQLRGAVSRNLGSNVPSVRPELTRWGDLYEGMKAARSSILKNKAGQGTGNIAPTRLVRTAKAAAKGAAVAGAGAGLYTAGRAAARKVMD